jgi:hypothetical protein
MPSTKLVVVLIVLCAIAITVYLAAKMFKISHQLRENKGDEALLRQLKRLNNISRAVMFIACIAALVWNIWERY